MGLWFRKRAPAAAKSDESLPIIRLEGVSKTFKGDSDDDTVALDDVSVDINRGEYVSISGPSGCGKSTFLSILGLLETPTSGHVLAERPADRSADPGRTGAGAQPRRRADIPELQPDRGHERVRERRVSADASGQVGRRNAPSGCTPRSTGSA